MEDGAPPHRCLAGDGGSGGSPRHVGGPRRESSRAGASSNLGPSFCPYSPKCVEQEFCEVHGSKRSLRRSGRRSTTVWRHPLGVETLRLGAFRCTFVYQGVATRNGATAREFLGRLDRGSTELRLYGVLGSALRKDLLQLYL